MNANAEPLRFFTISAAARYKGLAYNTIAQAIKDGRLVPESGATVVLISREQLDAFQPQRRSTKFEARDKYNQISKFMEEE
jgi:hypothetical protein